MVFDVVIRGGRVLDGTGAPWRIADLGIRRGKVARIGRLGRAKASRQIDASSMYVAPGFIDIHTHSDIGILVEPTAECATRPPRSGRRIASSLYGASSTTPRRKNGHGRRTESTSISWSATASASTSLASSGTGAFGSR